MGESKHTRGPWTYKHGDICGPDDADGDDLVLAAVGTSYGLRSSTYSIIRKGPEMKANAWLMAAAPDMLDALRKALNFIENTEGELGITLESGDAVRAAIAKAGAPHV